MQLELLPNEILIECFQYLNAIDIFHAFDCLNSRFSNLIRHIPLHLNIENVAKSKLIQFCTHVLSNEETKQRIVSLELPKTYISNSVSTLFSFVSLDGFSQLRALTLNAWDVKDIARLSSTLPLLTNLHYFCLNTTCSRDDKMMILLSRSVVQTLFIQTLPKDLSLDHPFTSLVNVTISFCYIMDLFHLFEYARRLRYLQIKSIKTDHYKATVSRRLVPGERAVHLRRLIIYNFKANFNNLKSLLTRTPKLKFLMISVQGDSDMMNALRWQDLITATLPLLTVFKFVFEICMKYEENSIVYQFEQFHTDFWQRWCTEYTSSKDRILIYSVPYMLDKYELTVDMKRYRNTTVNNTNTFANVTDLTFCGQITTDNEEYIFSNVKSLRITRLSDDRSNNILIGMKHIQCIKTLINLCNLTHLDISSEYQWELLSIVSQLLLESTHLSSLKIDKRILFSLFEDHELCKSFNKTIKILEVTGSPHYPVFNSFEIGKVCQIFSNLEEFRSYLPQGVNMEETLNHLSKLAHLRVFSYIIRYRNFENHWLEKHKSELELYSFKIKYELEFNEDVLDQFPYDYDSDKYRNDSDSDSDSD